MSWNFVNPIRMDNYTQSAGGGMSRDERQARKRAEEAERAFRASKGYVPDTFWRRLKRKFTR